MGLYAEVYGHDRTTASTCIDDNVVVCILDDILSSPEQQVVASGNASEVIDGRVSLQAATAREDVVGVSKLMESLEPA